MINTSGNARSTESKRRIIDSYKTLLMEKTPETITVKEICALAKVHRTTFYAHYSNIIELLEAVEAEMISMAGEDIVPEKKDITGFVAKDNMLRILHFIRENKVLYRLCFLQTSESQLASKLTEQVKITFILPELHKSTIYTEEEYDYQYEFCKEGTLGIINKWLMDGCKESDEVIAALLEKMLTSCLP